MDDQNSGAGPDRPTDKRADDAAAEHRPNAARKRYWRPGVWLATLSTVVAVATGMFTLRDQVFPNEGGQAQATPVQYAYAVAGICRSLNAQQHSLVVNNQRLAKELRHAKTPTSQRNAVLNSWNEALGQSGHELALFEGLAVPPALQTRERATQATWSQMTSLGQAFVQRLNAASNESELLAAVDTLPRLRTITATDDIQLAAGLTNLGAGNCTLDSPVNIPTVTLNVLAAARPETPASGRRSFVQASVSPSAPSSARVSLTTTAPPTPGIQANVSPTHTQAPVGPNVSTPASALAISPNVATVNRAASGGYSGGGRPQQAHYQAGP